MVSNIGIYKDNYIYKGNEYKKNNCKELVDKLLNKRNIVFLSQILLIKKYSLNSNKVKIEDFIEKKIDEDFSDIENFLFNYEYNKKDRIVYLYSIRNNNVGLLCNNTKELTVDSIQFYIKNKVIRKNKNLKNSIIVFKINSIFHMILLKEGYIENSIIVTNKEEIYENIKLLNDVNILIIDNTVNEELSLGLSESFKVYSINLVEGIYEKIYKK
ncbi:hypothetical protein [Clostridium tertium]|uniref:Uncharacterized protein n=1 Tax=Clostridium tertium TaxID=1559 RepID=A0A6N3GEF5_9CLOT